jgi:hypothetical protein
VNGNDVSIPATSQFTHYTFNFRVLATASSSTATITFSQLIGPTGVPANAGVLIDNVKVTRIVK